MDISRAGIAARLVKARELSKRENASEVARLLGIPEPTYLGHENGSRGLKIDAAQKYADFYRVNFEWLMTGRGHPQHQRSPKVQISHYVGAGAEVRVISDLQPGEGLAEVDAPPGEPDSVGAIIEGDSMFPMRAGWQIFYRKSDAEGVLEELIGKLCVVEIQDGDTLVKILRRGSRKGLWNLESWNAPLREDVKLSWAARVVDIRPT